MKVLLTAIVALLTLCAEAKTQNNDVLTQIAFDEYEYDFGEIKEIDGEVTHTFKYTNVGKNPLVIINISTSCGCTMPRYDKKAIKPGQSANMTVAFDPAGQPGRVEKKIIVRTNTPQEDVELKIKALVVPKPRTIEDDFPVMLADGIRLPDVIIDGFTTANSKIATFEMQIVNNSTKAAVVKLQVDSLPKWINATIDNPMVMPKSKGKIIVTINPYGSNLWGKKKVQIPLFVNNKKQFIDLNFVTTFIEDFTNLNTIQYKEAPKITTNSSFYHFSTLNSGEKTNHTFKIKNIGANDLIIRHIETDGRTSASIDTKNIKPNQEATVTIVPNTDNIEPIAESIRIICNDPRKPVVTFKVMANIK